MIITCANCRQRYSLDAVVLGEGRRVRCIECETVWFQEPKEPLSLKPPQDEDFSPRGHTFRAWRFVLAGGLFLGAIAGAGTVVYKCWPELFKRFVAPLLWGEKQPFAVGLRIRNLRIDSLPQKTPGGKAPLVLRAELANSSDQIRYVKKLRILLRDAKGQVFHGFEHSPLQDHLLPGEFLALDILLPLDKGPIASASVEL